MSTGASSPSILVSGVSRSFGSTTVVHEANLSVHPGQITALVGPNGSGKTTLMLMLATLLKPDSGEIRIGGHDAVQNPRAARATLGWMPDALGVWDSLTVRETLIAVCAMYGISGLAAGERVEALLTETALTALAGQRSHTLSRGQKQRLSLARALVHKPSVLLLDEPASGLDPEARLAQRQALEKLSNEGTAILITSHVLDELEQLANDVVFLREGHTSTDETVADAMRHNTRWRIRAIDITTLDEALAALHTPVTPQALLSGESRVVELTNNAEAAELLRSLVTAGVQIIEFSPATGSLEQAFLRFNQEATQ
ncbi:ABC transporter ATP-binding protein [Leucobacter coleopterorum]|uniref:ABC transporter ATP-binding protein n=1 Tax=Leucobacter coleopterorum TaxID=2714933 RepID=A0ABX6K1H8_9MICO|nr:ABC transporter ATP-binding protein [Leucobacter coleopterorum]QIM18960.1 ABC transporter ATP-binding protein [Leucobacter coleopterorum]